MCRAMLFERWGLLLPWGGGGRPWGGGPAAAVLWLLLDMQQLLSGLPLMLLHINIRGIFLCSPQSLPLAVGGVVNPAVLGSARDQHSRHSELVLR